MTRTIDANGIETTTESMAEANARLRLVAVCILGVLGALTGVVIFLAYIFKNESVASAFAVVLIISILCGASWLHRRDMLDMHHHYAEMVRDVAQVAAARPAQVIEQPSRPQLAAPFEMVPAGSSNSFVRADIAETDARQIMKLRGVGKSPTRANIEEFCQINNHARIDAALNILDKYHVIARAGQGSACEWTGIE